MPYLCDFSPTHIGQRNRNATPFFLPSLSSFSLTSSRRGKLGTVGQITVCRCKLTDRVLIFANTHLFYHPSAAFVRLLQTDAIIRAVMSVRDSITEHGIGCLGKLVVMGEERVAAEIDPTADTSNQITSSDSCSSIEGKEGKSSHTIGVTVGTPVPHPTVSIVFMGDLNSTPETAVIEYFDK